MNVKNYTQCGLIAYENDEIRITHYTSGSHNVLVYDYGLKMRVIKYASIPELFTDFQTRLYYLSTKKGRIIQYTPYGKECIKNWYKIKNG